MELEPGELLGWVRAFIFTQIIEVPLHTAALGLRPLLRRAEAWALWQRLVVAFLCSLVTHPAVWFVFPRLVDAYSQYVWMVVLAESFAVVVEAGILWRFGLRVHAALGASFLINMTSMSLGFLWQRLY